MKNTGKYVDKLIVGLFYTIVCCFIAFIVVGSLSLPDEGQKEISGCRRIDINWYQLFDDGSRSPLKAPGKCDCDKKEPVTIAGMLPESLDTADMPWLCITTSLQDIKVYIGGELRGEYDTKDTRLWGKNSASVYYFVRLRPSDKGKEIRLCSVSDSKYNGVVYELYSGTVYGIFKYFSKNMIFEVITALFLIIFSVLTIILCIIVNIRMCKSFPIFYLGWAELLLGLWVLCESSLRQLYFDNISLAGYITHFSLYMFAVPVIIYFDHVQDRRYSRVYRFLAGVELIFSIFAGLLEITDTVDFSILFTIAVVLHFVVVLWIIASIVMDIKRHFAREYQYVCMGFIGITICSVFQLVMYHDKTIVFHGEFICIGAMLMLFMAAISTIRNYFALEKENTASKKKSKNLTVQAMKTLVQAIEAKDLYTKGHSTRVARYSMLLAEKLGMTKEEQKEIYYMGMVHDIGKIGISDEIINKEGRLTDEEKKIIKTHSMIGYRILKGMSEIKNIEYGARWHHERYDGKGYPDGLSGEDIPFCARIIAVADAYDAMTSDRSYRKVMPQNVVRDELVKGKGTQFDPVIADCMIDIIDADVTYMLCQAKDPETEELRSYYKANNH